MKSELALLSFYHPQKGSKLQESRRPTGQWMISKKASENWSTTRTTFSNHRNLSGSCMSEVCRIGVEFSGWRSHAALELTCKVPLMFCIICLVFGTCGIFSMGFWTLLDEPPRHCITYITCIDVRNYLATSNVKWHGVNDWHRCHLSVASAIHWSILLSNLNGHAISGSIGKKCT